jgi:hypothetical protein
VAVSRDEPIGRTHDPANGCDPPQRADQPTAREHRGNRQGGVTAGVDPPGPFIEDMQLSKDRAVSGRSGHERPIGCQGVLERQELEPASAIQLTKPSGRCLAQPAVAVEHDHEAVPGAADRDTVVRRSRTRGHQPLLAASG